MRAVHQLSAVGVCPVDGTHDHYQIAVRTRNVLPVEQIRAAVEELLRGPTYQETFTRKLKTCLKEADEVETTVIA